MKGVLLITGAGGGLGSLVAAREAANFSEIALLDRNMGNLKASALAVEKSGSAAPHAIACDVSDFKALEKALSQFSSLDGLVNAAGVLGPVRRMGEGDFSAWAHAVGVNLVGNAAACHFSIPKLLKSRRGKIVNFSGGGAVGVRLQHSSYASAKAGIVRLTEIISAEYPVIDANAIAPGAHNTGIWKTETYDKPPEKWADKERFCDTVSFLLSEKSDGISGKLIHIYDKWEDFRPDITGKDIYAVRRIEPKR